MARRLWYFPCERASDEKVNLGREEHSPEAKRTLMDLCPSMRAAVAMEEVILERGEREDSAPRTGRGFEKGRRPARERLNKRVSNMLMIFCY